ncbi:MAG: magnesium transporter MgtE [Armatimonadota bacterium]|nr:MAG: magnesium transporter MgtE [Armatimonadota bacterium]
MKMLTLDQVAARLRLEAAQGLRKEAVEQILTGLHPSEVGAALSELPPETAMAVLRVLDRPLAALLLGEIPDELLEYVLSEMPMTDLARILSALRVEDNEKVASHIAEVLPSLDQKRQVGLFLALPRDATAEVFSLLDTTARDSLLLSMTDSETRQVLADLSPDDRTELFEELPGQATQRLLNLLSPEDLAEARRLLGYPEESVGRLMTPDYIAVRPDWTVARALEHIRSRMSESETSDIIYVTDYRWKLLDALDLKRFVMADPSSKVEDMMNETFVALSPLDDREAAVETMQRYDVSVLPVVDTDGTLVGIVTFDDVMDVAEEEATEDFHRVAAVAPLRKKLSETALFELVRSRVGWLLALVAVNLITGGIIALHTDVIQASVALVFFLPLLIASGGNAGAQAATLVVRALATGDVKPREWILFVLRDAAVAGSMGVIMGLAVSAVGLHRGGPDVAVTVGLSMVCIVLAGSLVGTILPFLLTRLRLDPATASAPLVTTMADITGVMIYFSIARRILPLV